MIERLIQPTFDSWRDAARQLLLAHVPPQDVLWTDARSAPALPFAEKNPVAAADRLAIPRSFVEQAQLAACYRDDARWSLLYRLAFRLTHGEPNLMSIAVEEDVS